MALDIHNALGYTNKLKRRFQKSMIFCQPSHSPDDRCCEQLWHSCLCFSPEPRAFHSYVILAKTGNRCCCWWSLFFGAILRSRAGSLRSQVILHEWIAFYSAILTIHRSGVITALAWLVPHETAAISAQVLCTPYNHAPCHFMQSHVCKVHAYLAVTCHSHF